MATIRSVQVKGHPYWQLVESRRIDGKPRTVVLMHLGTATTLLQKLQQGAVVKQLSSRAHGAVCLLWETAQRYGLRDVLRASFAPQTRDTLRVGDTLLLGAIHRAVQPASKRQFASWAKTTTLPALAGFDAAKLDSQHFWDQMHTVTDRQLEQAELHLTRKLMDAKLLNPATAVLFYDTTNFFTYIATDNDTCHVAQRGHNKQKRADLRQFGFSQIVTKEFLLPLASEVYPGNEADASRFHPMLTRFRHRLAELQLQLLDLTLVFDKGSTTKANFHELDNHHLHYVASLCPAYHEDLLWIPRWRYYTVHLGSQTVQCYRTDKTVWGKKRSVVLNFSDRLFAGQLRGLQKANAQKRLQLTALQHSLQSVRGRLPTKAELEARINAICQGEWGPLLFDAQLAPQDDRRFELRWSFDDLAYDWLLRTVLGKRILVTSRQDWDDAEIIQAYRGQSHIERFFRHIKNPYHHAFRPQFHWTDQNIKTHAFICVLAILLSQLLQREADHAGYGMSLNQLLDSLTRVRRAELVTLMAITAKPKSETVLEEMEPELRGLWEALSAKITR